MYFECWHSQLHSYINLANKVKLSYDLNQSYHTHSCGLERVHQTNHKSLYLFLNVGQWFPRHGPNILMFLSLPLFPNFIYLFVSVFV